MSSRRDFLKTGLGIAAASAVSGRLAFADEPENALDALVRSLSLEQKIGQLLMIGVPGTELSPEIADLFRALMPGAVILLGRNVREPAQLQGFTHALQSASDIPLLVALDQEGGTVVRLSKGATVFPGAMATGATGSESLAWLEGKVTGAELKAVGVNMNLAPVLDVNSNRNNPVIGVRAFGDDPLSVAKLGRAYITGLQSQGVSAVAKHFPGHGDAVEDSHRGLPVIAHGLECLRTRELKPFAAATAAGIDAMMTAHVMFPAIDDVPATMSKTLLTGVLRGELGFTGMLVTDDLEMKAIEGRIGVGPAAVRCIAAGADQVMILWQRKHQDDAFAALLHAVTSGELPMERVDEAARRVLAVKARRGALRRAAPGASDLAIVGSARHRDVAREIASRAVTVLWNRDAALPVSLDAAEKLVVLSSNDEFLAAMRAARPDVVEIHLPPKPDRAAAARVSARVAQLHADRLVIAVANDKQAALAAALATSATAPVIGVSLGAPYLLDGAGALAAYVCSYGWRPDSLSASARVLAGLEDAPGRAPVRLACDEPLKSANVALKAPAARGTQ